MITMLRPLLIMIVVCIFAAPISAQNPDTQPETPKAVNTDVPKWVSRGLPGPGHAALEPLAGQWRVHYEVHATLGRSADEPPLVSDDVTCKRAWVGGGRYLEDTTEGTVAGSPHWRRGWLGYSNMDKRYEWVTIDSTNSTMMIYLGEPGSGPKQPINMTGVFTDQGVAGEAAVGKRVPMRTEINIESNDRHTFNLYFTPPAKTEVLAVRTVYTRVSDTSGTISQPQTKKSKPIVLPTLPEPSPGETGPYCLISKHRAKPGKADEYEKRMIADLKNTRAEPGALQFHIHRHRSDPNLFVLYEIWKDKEALQKHFEMSYVQKFVADSAEYVDGDMEVEWLRMVSDYSPGR
jgi:quinol monooxygenase YgiN